MIALLIHYGADPNSFMSDPSYWLSDNRFYGTPMDLAIQCRDSFGSSQRGRLSESLLLEAALKKHGSEITNYMPPQNEGYKTILLCFHDPEFAIGIAFQSTTRQCF